MNGLDKTRIFLQEQDFRNKVFYMLLFFAMITSVIVFAVTALNDLSYLGLLSTFFCCAFIFAIAFYVHKTKNIKKASLYLCVTYNFVLFPLTFFWSGGSSGGMPLYFVWSVFSCGLFLDGALGVRIAIGTFVLDVLLLCVELFVPSSIMPFASPGAALIDKIFSFFVIAGGLSYITWSLKSEYYREQKRTKDLTEKLRDLAIHDGLTKLYNRRCLHTHLEKNFAQAARQGTPLGIIMLDLDYFKEINDTFGHTVGDKVLKKLARILEKNVRGSDIVGRYGGEEFLVILLNSSLDVCLLVAERIRKEMEEITIQGLQNLKVTISDGVSIYNEGYKTANALLKQRMKTFIGQKNMDVTVLKHSRVFLINAFKKKEK